MSNPSSQPAVDGARPAYSVVVPFYNEAENVEAFYQRVVPVMDGLGKPYELVFINDGSTDGTEAILERLAAADGRVTVVELRRNFGQTAGIAAGFDHAAGEIVIAMDGDLQHAPEDIPALLKPIEEGYDLVSGWRERRVDNLFLRRIPSGIANRLMRRLCGVEIHDFGTTFKAYRRDLLEHIDLYGEMHRFIPALASAVGARICEVPIQNIERAKGKSKYGLGRTLRVLMDIMTVKFLIHYFTRPLHLLGMPGLFCFFMGACIEVGLIVEKIARGWGSFHLIPKRGPMMMVGVFLLIASLIFFAAGILGELIIRTYYEAQGKRIYIVRKVHHRG